MRLDGKVVLIAGGSGALGQAIAPACVEAGAKVITVDRHPPSIQRKGIVAMTGDVTDQADTRRLVTDVIQKAGRLDVLINLVGGFAEGRVQDTDATVWQRMLTMNLTSGFLLSRAVLPAMTQQRAGRILREVGSRGADPDAGVGIDRFGRNRQRRSAQHDRYAEQQKEHARCRPIEMGQAGVDCRPASVPGVRRSKPDQRLIDYGRMTKGATMKAHYLGHVVFYVKDLQRSLTFYRDLLGFKEVGHIFNGAAAALTSGRTHHELLLIQVGDAPGPPAGRRRGLYHIGIKVGDTLDELRLAKKELEQAGVSIDGMSDHTVSQSLYLRDPDGNEVELYVDADESIWKDNPDAVVSPIKPLRL